MTKAIIELHGYICFCPGFISIQVKPIFYCLKISAASCNPFKISLQDKNRDVIVAFPDVDPSIIMIPEVSKAAKHQYINRRLSERGLSKEISDSYEQPHLWYSTTDVIYALKLFLDHGDEVSDSQTFR